MDRKRVLLVVAVLFSVVSAVVFGADVVSDLRRHAPWALASYSAAHALFLGGAVVMLAGAGAATRNPLRLRENLPLLRQRIGQSRTVRVGFWTNLVGAVAAAAVVIAAVVIALPWQSWGLGAIALLDLGATLVVRKAIWDSLLAR